MYAFELTSATTRRRRRRGARRQSRRQVARGRPEPVAAMKLRLAQPGAARRPRRGIAELKGITQGRRRARHRRHDAPCRCRDVADGEGARFRRSRRSRGAHRRPPGAQHAARSAARSPTTIRRPTIPPPCWRWARRSSPTSARSPPTTSSRACSRRRSTADELITAVAFPVPKKAAYVKFRNPASRFALVGVFVAQTAAACASRSPARRHRRVPREGAGGGAGEELRADAAQGVKVDAAAAQQRSARERRVPRAPRSACWRSARGAAAKPTRLRYAGPSGTAPCQLRSRRTR